MTDQSTAVVPQREVRTPEERNAVLLAKSDIVPAAYQDKPANVFVAQEYANRLGCSVLAVMQNLDVIHGRPSLRATFLIGTVNACGRFTPIRFRFEGTKGQDDWGCRAWAKDRETGEECIGPLITIGLAKAEGWYSKKDRNGRETSKWQTIPELMLHYRAAAWWSRIYAPDLSLGLRTSDESEDIGPSLPSPRTHAQAVAAALAASDEIMQREGPDYETIPEGNGNGEPVTGNGEHVTPEGHTEPSASETDPIRSKYFTLLAERGLSGDVDRREFQKQLHKNGLVRSASSKEWAKLDYQSAMNEVRLLPVPV